MMLPSEHGLQTGGRVATLLSGNRFLLGSLLLLTLVVWFEPAGSWLAEPDETRYAEIPREMLASGDFVTPQLNSVPYLEKPPLFYWANAASFKMFGESTWAARLPARVVAVGSTFLILLAVGRLWGARSGLVAAILFLASPLGFVLSRLNTMDGMLTFFFTATVFAGYATIRRAETGKNALMLSTLAGVAAAGGMLTKGLVAVVLPGAILLLWSLATGRVRHLRPLILGPALPVFLLLSVPWFLVMESRHAGFLEFIFFREHVARFLTSVHRREGPFYYFLPVLVAGFLPGLPFLVSALKNSEGWARQRREHSEELLFLIWVSVVFVFFSLSSSKLIPYVLPAWPALAALAARAGVIQHTERQGRSAVWLVHAVCVTLLVLAASLHPSVPAWIADYHLLPIALLAAVTLLSTAWLAHLLARRRFELAFCVLAAGWAALYVSLSTAWPKVPQAVAVHELARVAKEVAFREGATVISYRDLLRGLPWELKSPVPIGDYGNGEIRPQLHSLRAVGPEVFWQYPRFWSEWQSGRRYLAVVREGDVHEFDGTGLFPQMLSTGYRRVLLANFPVSALPKQDAITSVAFHNRYRGKENRSRVRLKDLPPQVIARARREKPRERFIYAFQEAEDGWMAYELITGARKPLSVEVSDRGGLVSMEEVLSPDRLPAPVLRALHRSFPGSRIELVTREYQRAAGPSVLYEVYVRQAGQRREIKFETTGRIFGTELLPPAADPS